mmetsp:Transcript_22275/g.40133  ORF Transcript_22275/g.40133 Transcript_22275/m.40133 type:complete len:183 (-) Transcript_22275:64-612(-)|eukprot:CAMPEP_0197662972 /NCGR_PEP_ID=MMETSP1338-20131121/55577_1 /TAXON_ID=43686 ORGANISM="Pelagodinium beii, Strain RCC1491" /NCGR_SAMPLE_ID=MMETSP1338 /ASSEMBLY_ACC=CAM_ASM_000754 /LENGTH=182 /DNA_ID=CAMNT_0043241105 /DNA_START=94 /DNA_END=642 /DNA_ORIENTATION=-
MRGAWLVLCFFFLEAVRDAEESDFLEHIVDIDEEAPEEPNQEPKADESKANTSNKSEDAEEARIESVGELPKLPPKMDTLLSDSGPVAKAVTNAREAATKVTEEEKELKSENKVIRKKIVEVVKEGKQAEEDTDKGIGKLKNEEAKPMTKDDVEQEIEEQQEEEQQEEAEESEKNTSTAEKH